MPKADPCAPGGVSLLAKVYRCARQTYWCWLSILVSVCVVPSQARAQELGHRILGTLGLDAGMAPEPGVYVAGRFVYYGASRLRDRDGNVLPIEGLQLDVFAQALGASGTIAVAPIGGTLSIAAAAPLVWLDMRADRPEASLDRFGLGDVYLQPSRLGWRLAHVDIVASYAVYLPTDRFVLGGEGGGVSRGHVTHQFSAGGTWFPGAARSAYMTALASYDLNMRKRGIDITRGDSVQIQGGAGVALRGGVADLGVIGYALWQVRDDRGSELPAELRGARERVFGLGPELSVALPAIRARLTVRYAKDFGAKTRPEGQVLFVGLNVVGYRPEVNATKRDQRGVADRSR